MFAGGTSFSCINRDTADILNNTNVLVMLKHTRSARGYEEKCYDWSSIFPTPRTKLCHLVDIQDLLCELGGAGESRSLCMTTTGYQYGKDCDIDVIGDLVDVQDVLSLLSCFSGRTESSENQSIDNLHALDSDEHHDVADSTFIGDCFTSRIAVDLCWVIGFIISLLCLVKTYSWACKDQKRKSRPVICVPMHTLEARTKALSMCCWKGHRQSCVVARFRKAFRKWRWESVSVRHQRSNMILGGVFVFVLMFQPVAEGGGAFSDVASVSKTADLQPNLDMSQLAQLDVDPVLMKFIGNVVTELKEVKTELHKLTNNYVAVGAELARVQNRTKVFETENMALRAELQQLRKDKETFENKTRVVEAAVRKENAALWITVIELQNQTNTNNARLDQCESGKHPFIEETERRRMQDEETLCNGSGLSAMFAACCPSSGGNGGRHQRFLQSQGCDVLPDTCSLACAPLFIEFFEGCQHVISDVSPEEQQGFEGLYADCNEAEQQGAMANMQAVEVKMFRVNIDQEAEQQAAALANDGSRAPSPPFGPVVLPPS
eukprot:SAG31_NODE_5097_length_2746_cov_4.760106_3_plen_547_part_01